MPGTSTNADGLAERLAALGLKLPAVQAPLASYLPARQVADLLYLSGHVCRDRGTVVRGTVGADIEVAAATGLARAVALDLLASACAALGTADTIVGVVRITGYVRSAPGFDAQPAVIDGASDLFVELFGDAGRHARSAVGVSQLPLGAAVEIEAIFEVRG
ncbi:MAG: RidA family protein [Candidatus Dormibacteraeota bacterium]|uniref:RidA family protein n=1 Tax=Candidatus Amunia macphersoniae TaxID=3127014 RepID=A0A934KJN4_9BACT|nr:RidA family protein [Candidatus Dormibacteraeota bacterium]